MTQSERGADGWRYARCGMHQGLSSRSYRRSRSLHYFKNGYSLCGAHHDDEEQGWDRTTYSINSHYEKKQCKKCLKKLEVADQMPRRCPYCDKIIARDSTPESSFQGMLSMHIKHKHPDEWPDKFYKRGDWADKET